MLKAIYQSAYNQKRLDSGLCAYCGRKRDTENNLCTQCKKKQSERLRTTKQSRIKQGLCPRCGKVALPNSQLCCACFFYHVAAVTLKNVKMAQDIATLYDKQNGRCAYTDVPLILGINASIDHKTPQCRGGSHDIENLQWVTKRINGNKFNLTHEEFVAECAYIAAKFQ